MFKYQHDRVKIVIKDLCVLVLRTKVDCIGRVNKYVEYLSYSIHFRSVLLTCTYLNNKSVVREIFDRQLFLLWV